MKNLSALPLDASLIDAFWKKHHPENTIHAVGHGNNGDNTKFKESLDEVLVVAIATKIDLVLSNWVRKI